MRAMVLRGFGPVEARPLTLEDAARPVPGPRELLVRVLCCGVCHTDLHIAEGDIVPPRLPVIPGHQVVGIVEEHGADAGRFDAGQRVGVAWLGRTCGSCVYCGRDDENLCERAVFNGFDLNGGYAEYVLVHEDFAYSIPDGFSDEQAAPLLCAGIIGYRSIRLSGAAPGKRVGLYGFGASAHVAIQVLAHWGCDIYVFSRSGSHRKLAAELGAVWTGRSDEDPPVPIDSSIIFAPAGETVPGALRALDRGGTVALAGIHMSAIPGLDYQTHLYNEKVLRSVTASTRRDGVELLELAAEIPIRTKTTAFPLEEANDVLLALKQSGIDGAAVLRVAEK